MKNLFRNPAFRRETLLFWLAALLCVALSLLAGLPAALAVFIASAVLYAVVLLSARRRYRLMAELADGLDRILHGGESFDLDRFSEGELSILQSELSKLLVTLRTQADTLQSDKRALADSLADISHQLKTPLTGMGLAASMLADPDLSPERRTALTRDIQRQLTRLEWLVTALLKISRLDAGTAELRPRELTVRRLVDDAAAPLLIPLELRDVTLRRDFTGDETLTADPAWAAEAIGNILKNCMEHTPPGGAVTVSARENAVYTQLTVTDTGPGIDPEDLPHIFERFYRGKNADAQSAGIGLALARTILRASGASVKAENAPEGGARFTVRFYKSTV